MRQLAAIMFTDIVGYTAIMQGDEQRAVKIRSKHRKVFKEQHDAFNGTLVQYFGDGTLSMFKSAVEAVHCAKALQRELNSGELKVPVRIGIHLGDIFYDGTEVFGDGVNVAARVESISASGAVLISEHLNRELKNKNELPTQSLGEYKFKNVTDTIEVFAVCSEGLTIPDPDQMPVKNNDSGKSVAVLPFENMSPATDYEYLSDGMTEEIINALTKIRELKVTSRTSSFHFKGKSLSIKEIGKQLDVSTIVVGSVRLAGGMMRISTQLIDVKEDYSFWSETYDRTLDNIFATQDEISMQIADRLREHLGHLQIDNSLVKKPDVSVSGYTEYLKGRFYLLKMSPKDIKTGMEILEEVTRSNPDYVYGWLGMHMGYALLGTLGIMKAEMAFAEGHKYLQKAVELDEDRPECQLQLAWMSFLQDWDLEATYAHLQKVHEQSPIVDYYQTMTSVIVVEKKFKAAENYIETAHRMDPLSDITHHLRGFVHYVQEQYQEAIANYRRSIELKPGAEVSYMELGESLILTGKANEALKFFSTLPEETASLMRKGGMALAHAALGNKKEAEEGIESIKAALNSDQIERALNLLILCETVLGNYDQAITYIEQGISYRLPLLLYLKLDPMLKPLRDIERYKEIMKVLPDAVDEETTQPEKTKKLLISDDTFERYHEELTSLMEIQKPYLDPFLTLRDLAEMMGIPANQLSQLLNEGFDQNFSEFVNTYRLEHFKSEIQKPEKQQFTLLAIAFECGFNSKTVFNSFFKKTMGTTPSKYLKSVLQQ